MLFRIVDRVAAEILWQLAVRDPEAAQELWHPTRAELDGGHAQRGMTVEDAVAHERGHGVEDRALYVDAEHLGEGGAP